jgi:hypothetical protein
MTIETKWVILLLAISLASSGLVDLDWMIVAPRFNSWYYSVNYWEFNPYIQMNWWLAYFITLMRIVIGTLIIGFLAGKETRKDEKA